MGIAQSERGKGVEDGLIESELGKRGNKDLETMTMGREQ